LGGFGGGWLTFDDGTERRRLAPVPENWERLSDVRLALLLRAASGRLERSPSIGGPIAAVTSGARANGACTTAGALANPPNRGRYSAFRRGMGVHDGPHRRETTKRPRSSSNVDQSESQLVPAPRKSSHLFTPRPAAPSLESVLAMIGAALSAADLDEALRTARRRYAGSMMEQLEQAGAERARYLLGRMSDDGAA